jgi:Uma2 family endonuclease
MATPKIPPAATYSPAPDEEEDFSIIYPSGDGEPMAENDWQWTAMTDAVAALRNRYGDRSDVYVAGDMLVYYRMNDVSARTAPDVYVVFGANGNHRRDSWLVWREGKVPDFVLEVASPGTWEHDAGGKRDIYAAMGVTEYWRFDPRGEFFVPELIGERFSGGAYRPLPLQTDASGILRGQSAVLGLDICVRPGLELRFYDPGAGQWLLTPAESEAARQAAEAALQDAQEENRRLREQLRSIQTGQ